MKRTSAVLAVLLGAAACGGKAPAVLQGDYDKAGSAVNPVRPEGYVPPMDPRRKVSEQDCGEAVDSSDANLKCRPRSEAERLRRQEEERQRLAAARRAKLEEEERLRREAAERAERERLERERAEQLAREEAARKAREAEEERLAAERRRLEAERKAAEELAARQAAEALAARQAEEALARQRAEQEAREAAERERQRLEEEWLAGRALLERFMASYGKAEKFKDVAGPIGGFLDKTR